MQSTEYSDQRPSRPSEISEVSSHSIHVLHFSPASNLCQGFNLPAPFSLWLIQVDESPDRQARRGSEVTRTLAQTLQIQRKWVSSRAATLIDLQFGIVCHKDWVSRRWTICVWNLRCKKWSDLHWSVMKCIWSVQMNLPTLAFCPAIDVTNLCRTSSDVPYLRQNEIMATTPQMCLRTRIPTLSSTSPRIGRRELLLLLFLFCCFVTCFVSVVLSFSPVSTTYSQKSGT